MHYAEKKGIIVDSKKLSEKLGIPVICTSARAGKGIEELKKTIILSILVFLIISIVFAILMYNQYRKYTITFNGRLNEIIYEIQNKYPNVSIGEIAGVLNSNVELI